MVSDWMKRWTGAVLALSMTAVMTGAGQVLLSGGTDMDVDVTGTLYILEARSATLSLYDQNLRLIASTGGPGWENGRFDQPSGVWARNGLDIFVADYGNHRIQRFDRQLAFVSALSTRDNDDPDQRFGYPTDVALSRQGDLYVCDGENQRVVRINRLSQVEKIIGGFDAGKGKLDRPTRIAAGPKDDLYVLDGRRILVFDAFGNFLVSLYDSMWKAPSALCGDEEGVLVADSAALVWFGPDQQLLGHMQIGSQTATIGVVRGVARQNGKLYLLGEHGLAVLEDPFRRGKGD